MASPQFIQLLESLHQTAPQRRLHWQPVRRHQYGSHCAFCIALGAGVVRVDSNDDDEHTLHAEYRAYLTTRDGLLVDEIIARQHESDYYPLLRELYHQARIAAFNLSRMVDEMQHDLEAGVTRELPADKFEPNGDIPF